MKNPIVISGLFLLINLQIGCEKIGAGSYPNAKRYTVNTSEDKTIDAVIKFKTEHPEYCPPDTSWLKDGKSMNSNGTEDYWYHVYFYYSDSKRYINSWVRGDDVAKTTTIALVSISKENTDKEWLGINSDLKDSDNDAVIKEFEERILNPIKEILSK